MAIRRKRGERLSGWQARKRKAIRIAVLDETYKEITMTQISADMKRTLTALPVDNKGRPANIEGIPVWTVSPEGGVLLFPAPNGMTCEVAWKAPMASQVVKVEADADLGAGISLISGTVDIETLPPMATSINVLIGPEEII